MAGSVSELIDELRVFFDAYALRYQVAMAFIYGSRAAGLERLDSDVDIAVVFQETVADDDKVFSLITEISRCLSEQLKREVNIISIDNDFLHPMLYYNAVILGKPVFIADKDKYMRLILETIYQMEDFQIFGINWQREAAKKNMEGFYNV